MAVSQRSPLIAPTDLSGKVALDSVHFGHDLYISHHKTHGSVLIKTVYTGQQLSESKRKSLLKEVEPLLRLNHSHVLRVLGVVLDDRPSYLVMEFVPIGNLLAVLEEGTVPISIKGRIILDILDGMVYLTNCNIVHGDLKPQNILVGEDFHIKIADLELASCRAWSKLTMEESRRRSRKGACSRAFTLCYMAPENRQNIHAPFTQKSDVYSFAVIIWVILTNTEPHSRKDQNETPGSSLSKRQVQISKSYYPNCNWFRIFQDIIPDHPDDQVTGGVCEDSGPDENLIPPSSPMGVVTLMRNCWLQDPTKRPTFAESYKTFQCFYRDELEKNEQGKDLRLTKRIVDSAGIHTNKSQYENPDLITKMSALALIEPHWQTDAPSRPSEVPVETRVEGRQCQDGLWMQSLQTDACLVDCSRAPHGSFVSSPDVRLPLAPIHRHTVLRQTSSNPLPRHGEDSSLPPVMTMRERKSEGVGRTETCPNCAPQHPNHRIRSWPVFPEPGPHGCGAETSSASELHRQRSAGVFIQHATGVQIGDNNQLTIEWADLCEDDFQPSSADCPQYEDLLKKYEDCTVRRDQLELLSQNIGRNWRRCARRLGLSGVEVETIGYDFARDGLAEIVHQMLGKWQMKTGTAGGTMGALCRALQDSVGVDVLCRLLLMCQGRATP